MSDTVSSSTPTPSAANSSPDKDRNGQSGGDKGLVTEQGKTTIADTVVAKIAGIATREVSGVHALGGGTARAMGAIRDLVPGNNTNHSQGVSVEVGERQAAVDIELTADYGVAIADLAAGIRRNVITAVEKMTGLEVSEVNITVQDVYLESEDSDEEQADEDASPRVQ